MSACGLRRESLLVFWPEIRLGSRSLSERNASIPQRSSASSKMKSKTSSARARTTHPSAPIGLMTNHRPCRPTVFHDVLRNGRDSMPRSLPGGSASCPVNLLPDAVEDREAFLQVRPRVTVGGVDLTPEHVQVEGEVVFHLRV